MAKSLSLKTRHISYLPSLSVLLQRIRTIVHAALPTANQNLPLPVLASDSSDDSCSSLRQASTGIGWEVLHRGHFTELSKTLPNLTLFESKFPLPSCTGVQNCDTIATLHSATNTDTFGGIFDDKILKLESQPTEVPSSESKVEMLVQESPAFLLKSFQELIPELPELSNNKLSVVCLSERTTHDMSRWCVQMSEEREELTLNFINSAKEICERIEEFGFWADFIDPSSGQPYYGASGSDNLTETDDRMRHFGFSVEDLGCCKCLRHSSWGTHVFVGVIVTTAPTTSTIISSLMTL